MYINNKKQAIKYKRIFFIVSILIALAALVLFLLDYTLPALITVGVFSLWYLFFHVADYQFIEFSTNNNSVVLRYYKAISFGKANYHSIEFPQKLLRKVNFENSVFGKLSDISFIVQTQRGIAEYESVSLAAVPFNDRIKMREALHDILYR